MGNTSVIDMKFDNLEYNKPTLNSYYYKLYDLILKKNNETEVFNKFYKYMKLFLTIYPNENNINITNFKYDGKKLFEIICKIFDSDEIIEEINKDNDILKKEKNEYMEFINNIHYITSNFDNLYSDFNNNTEFATKFKETINFLEKKNNDMLELTNTMQSLHNSLKKLSDRITDVANTLTTTINKDDEIISESELMEKK